MTAVSVRPQRSTVRITVAQQTIVVQNRRSRVTIASQGVQGPPGADGAPGSEGPEGPQGPPGQNAEGTEYLDRLYWMGA